MCVAFSENVNPFVNVVICINFVDKFSKYDQRDIDRLNSDDAYARCFLRTLKSRGDTSKALDVIHEAFKFRKATGIWGENK